MLNKIKQSTNFKQSVILHIPTFKDWKETARPLTMAVVIFLRSLECYLSLPTLFVPYLLRKHLHIFKTHLSMKTFLIAEALLDESQPQRQLTSPHSMTPYSTLLIILLRHFYMCLPSLGCNVVKNRTVSYSWSYLKIQNVWWVNEWRKEWQSVF